MRPVGVVVARVLLAIAAVVAAGRRGWCLRGRQAHPGSRPAAAAPGPFTGTYRADFGPIADFDDAAGPLNPARRRRSPAPTASVRCAGPPGAWRPRRASAAHRSGNRRWCSTRSAGAGWRSPSAPTSADKHPPNSGRSSRCNHVPTAPSPANTPRLPPTPAPARRTVTFTRTGDVDVNSLPDPGRPTAAGGVAGRSAAWPLPR